MKVLVTGAAGFLGSHLCEALLKEGHQVLGVDNFYTGTRENVTLLSQHNRFSFLQHDICKPLDVKSDAIFNLACPASPPHYQRDPVYTLRTSVMGTSHLLDLAEKLQIPFFQASTSEVYGDPAEHPQKESYHGNVNPIGIRACYDEGKRAAETLCLDFKRHRGVDVRVVRIFNTYGPRLQEGDGRVISNLIVQAIRGRDLTLYGDGLQTRSFCYVDDLIRGFLTFFKEPTKYPGPVNIGNPVENSIFEVAQKIIKLTGSRSKIIYQPMPSDDPKKRKPDTSLILNLTGWSAEISLEQGLKKTIDWFMQRER